MNIKNIINNYAECNLFEIKYKNNKLNFYFYDKIKHFSSNKIEVLKNNDKYSVIGENLVIESMCKEQLIISGIIYDIKMECTYE